MLAVDAGDFASYYRAPGDTTAWRTTEFLARSLGRLNLGAWTPGERELFYGRESLLKLVEVLGADVVAANLTDTRGKLLFADRVVKTLGPIRVGITGVISRAVFQSSPPDRNAGEADFGFADPFDSLKPIVADLRVRCDLVVVLAHVGPGDARQIAGEVPGIDVIVVGHNPGYSYEPERLGSVLVVRGGHKGEYAARLDLTFDAARKITGSTGLAEPLNRSVNDDVETVRAVARFQRELAGKGDEGPGAAGDTSGTAPGSGPTEPSPAAPPGPAAGTGGSAREPGTPGPARPPLSRADKYLGAAVCGRCHSDVLARWTRGPHARAFRALLAAGRQDDGACVACHTTGFGDSTGFRLGGVVAGEAAATDSTHAASLRNVQCESCHGRGTMHGTPAMVTKVPRETCVTCHDAANDPGFDYDKALAAGTHH